MKFEWDENKNKSNIEKHGIDFNDAKDVFNDSYRITSEDKRMDYGEKRWISIGLVSNIFLTIVYTVRNAIRIISARRSNQKEKQDYETNKQKQYGNK